MKKKAFTFVEILIVVLIVGMLTISGLGGFKHSRDSHQVDSLLQELVLLRTAILSYRETYGSLPEIEMSALASNNFDALKPFWYPFRPEDSKIIEGGEWWGMLCDDQSYLAVKKCHDYLSFDVDILSKKMQELCCVDATRTCFYFLMPY